MKKYMAGLLTGIILMTVSIGFAASGIKEAYYNPGIRVQIDGEWINTTPITVIDEGQQYGRNFTSVRDIAEAMGGTVGFDPDSKIISIAKPLTDIEEVSKNSESCVMLRVYKGGDYVGQGSGVVWNGYIITNKHVLDAGTKWTVEYDNSTKTYTAERVTIDTTLDIGILKSPREVKSVTLGDSDKVITGQAVVGISCPRGNKNSVSEGVVSSIGRWTGNEETIIQTTTNSSPGSSGGGLFDYGSNLIGITSNGWDGEKISAAIAINEVKKILEDLED